MALFDAYVMVDWSAAATPVRGADSIWFAVASAASGGACIEALENPATRAEATRRIGDRLAALRAAGARVLVGFDFPFGYPAGTAAALGLPAPAWRATWAEIDALIDDAPDNRNNRFDVAEGLNRRISGEAFPFWGHGTRAERRYLRRRGRRPHGPADLAERRLVEARVPRAQPVWKLAYTGAVGSQVLTGIPCVRRLRADPRLAPVSAIWPFETGLRHDPGPGIVLAEVYPSIFTPKALPGKPKDAGQVAAAAEGFARLDAVGGLAALFSADPALGAAERRRVESEEAWILGVTDRPFTAATGRPAYLRDPAAIYRRSFKIVRAEADLTGLPPALHDVVVRMIHACGMPEIAAELAFTPDVAEAARAAFRAGAPVLADSEMVRRGITAPAARGRVICCLDDPRLPGLATARATTRSAAAVELWAPRLDGAVVVIGNAPTALFALLERLDAGGPRPAAILAFPVGFVGAAESKAALARDPCGVPFLTLLGRRGGSAIAAAAVNALAAGVA